MARHNAFVGPLVVDYFYQHKGEDVLVTDIMRWLRNEHLTVATYRQVTGAIWNAKAMGKLPGIETVRPGTKLESGVYRLPAPEPVYPTPEPAVEAVQAPASFNGHDWSMAVTPRGRTLVEGPDGTLYTLVPLG